MLHAGEEIFRDILQTQAQKHLLKRVMILKRKFINFFGLNVISRKFLSVNSWS